MRMGGPKPLFPRELAEVSTDPIHEISRDNPKHLFFRIPMDTGSNRKLIHFPLMGDRNVWSKGEQDAPI